MTYRQTFVVEYEKDTDAPGVNSKTECMGGKLVAVQFSDALAEGTDIRNALQDLIDEEADHDVCDDGECLWCKAREVLAGEP
jgi:hypothetical protein